MKKIAYFSVLVCACVVLVSCSSASSSKALSDAEIIAFYQGIFQSQMPDAEVSVGKREQLDGGFESVELVIKVRGMQSSEFLFVKEGYIFPDVIDVKNKKSFREELAIKQYQSSKAEFDNKVKAAKIYVFTDPECPFCRQHLANIEQELESRQINIILTSVHGESAFKKVAQIYLEAKNAKTDSAKIAILRRYYAPNVKTPKVAQKDYEAAVALYEKYAAMGLRSVPAFVEVE